MANEVEIIITAKDQASDQIKDVSGAMGGLQGAADEVLTGALRGIGENLLPMIGGVITGVTDAVGSFVDAAMESEQVQVRLDAKMKALGDSTKITAKNINDIADSFSVLTGIDDEALVDAQTALVGLVGDMPLDMFERTVELASDLAKMSGMDLTTAFQMVGKALQDPEAGMGRMIKWTGDLTEEEKALIDSFLESGNILGAQGVILGQLQDSVGGTAEAMGATAQGALDKFALAMGNIQESLGAALLPAIQAIAPILIDMANQFSAFVSSDQFQVWLDDIITYLTGQLIPALQQFGDWFINTGVPALQSATESSQGFIDGIGRIKAAFDTLIAFNPMTWFTTLAKEIWSAAKGIGEAFDKGIIEGIRAFETAVITAIVGVIMSGYDAVKALLGIQSPSKAFAEIGKNMMLGLGQGINANASFPINAVTGATAALAPAAMGAGGRGGGFTFVYSPAVSLGNRDEFETKIIPMLDEADRRRRR